MICSDFFPMICARKGLDSEKDHILEIACIITEGNLKVVAEVCECFCILKINCCCPHPVGTQSDYTSV